MRAISLILLLVININICNSQVPNPERLLILETIGDSAVSDEHLGRTNRYIKLFFNDCADFYTILFWSPSLQGATDIILSEKEFREILVRAYSKPSGLVRPSEIDKRKINDLLNKNIFDKVLVSRVYMNNIKKSYIIEIQVVGFNTKLLPYIHVTVPDIPVKVSYYDNQIDSIGMAIRKGFMSANFYCLNIDEEYKRFFKQDFLPLEWDRFLQGENDLFDMSKHPDLVIIWYEEAKISFYLDKYKIIKSDPRVNQDYKLHLKKRLIVELNESINNICTIISYLDLDPVHKELRVQDCQRLRARINAM